MEITFNVADTIQSLAAVIGAVFAGLAYLKATRAAAVSKENNVAIAEVKHLTNSLSEKAQALSLEKGLAEGDARGRKEQTAERLAERASEAANATVAAAAKTVAAAITTVDTVSEPSAIVVAEKTVAAAETTLEKAKKLAPEN